jgi:hypothetical protein
MQSAVSIVPFCLVRHRQECLYDIQQALLTPSTFFSQSTGYVPFARSDGVMYVSVQIPSFWGRNNVKTGIHFPKVPDKGYLNLQEKLPED